jgi:hypothetical protein
MSSGSFHSTLQPPDAMTWPHFYQPGGVQFAQQEGSLGGARSLSKHISCCGELKAPWQDRQLDKPEQHNVRQQLKHAIQPPGHHQLFIQPYASHQNIRKVGSVAKTATNTRMGASMQCFLSNSSVFAA